MTSDHNAASGSAGARNLAHRADPTGPAVGFVNYAAARRPRRGAPAAAAGCQPSPARRPDAEARGARVRGPAHSPGSGWCLTVISGTSRAQHQARPQAMPTRDRRLGALMQDKVKMSSTNRKHRRAETRGTRVFAARSRACHASTRASPRSVASRHSHQLIGESARGAAPEDKSSIAPMIAMHCGARYRRASRAAQSTHRIS